MQSFRDKVAAITGAASGIVALALLLLLNACDNSGIRSVAPSVPAGAVSAQTRAAPAQVDRPLRSVTGTDARITDDLGRTVILRGANSNQLGEYYQAWPDLPSTVPLNEDDFAGMAAMGMNVVRLIINWSRLEPQRGEFNEAYVEDIAQAVRWARAHDVYVLLDMHQDAWSPFVYTPDDVTCPSVLQAAVGWDGAPLWATALVGTVATCREQLREASFAVATSFQNFYDDADGIQGELVKTWAALAGRFAGESVIAGYDLLNEPNPGLVPGISDSVLLGTYYGRVIDAIRAAEAARQGGFSHIAFFEPEFIQNGVSAYPLPPATLIADSNIVFSPHLYNESINPVPGGAFEVPGHTIESGFADAVSSASNYSTTFFVGEWGWFGDPASDQSKIERYAAAEDAHRVGGTWWQWRQACGDPHANQTRGARPGCADTSELSDGLLTRPRENTRVLNRAYPRATPGVLRSIEADVSTGSLVVTGDADAANVPADLWVPVRCGTPKVSGSNIGAATSRAVPGGWRVAVPVMAAGDYRIAITCGGGGGGAGA